jgi:hypothetical protein
MIPTSVAIVVLCLAGLIMHLRETGLRRRVERLEHKVGFLIPLHDARLAPPRLCDCRDQCEQARPDESVYCRKELRR